MLTTEKNQLLTSTMPDSSAGGLLRRYWQPAALAEELDGSRPAKAVRLMSEDLVLFRDDQGEYGLIGRQCPHRGADLCYGRLEDGGLRCPFHGWLFDRHGACLEQPAEPEGSDFHRKISHTAYPCVERNGVIFAFMGAGEPPALPDYDCFLAPDSHCFAFKGYLECNWLQAVEVGIDPAHASFLHRFIEDGDPEDGYGQQFRDAAVNTDIPVTKILRDFPRPDLQVEETDYGMRLFALRRLDEASMHVRVTNLMFPNAIVIPMSRDMVIAQWHVPIDDTHCWWYAIFTDYRNKVDKATMRAQRLELYTVPDYKPRRNRSNNYGYNPEEQRTKTFTGMGMDINVHDQWAVESPGPIQDRTKEHLGATDVGIAAYRRMLLRAIRASEEGVAPKALDPADAPLLRGPVAIDTIARADAWREDWKQHDLDRRAASDWASDPWPASARAATA